MNHRFVLMKVLNRLTRGDAPAEVRNDLSSRGLRQAQVEYLVRTAQRLLAQRAARAGSGD